MKRASLVASIVLVMGAGFVVGAEDLEKALAVLKACDAIIKVDESQPDKPVVAVHFRPNAGIVTDDDLISLKAFPKVRCVDLPNKRRITDEGLAHLVGLSELEELGLNGTTVTAKGVVQFVKARTRLIHLDLTGVPMHDEDLAALKGLTNLQSLNLRGSLVTNDGLVHLQPFKNLRELSLMSTTVGDAGLEHLEHLTNLEDLDLDQTAITDAGLSHLRGLSKLRRLQMAGTAVTDAGLEHLQPLVELRGLNVRGTKVTKEGLAKLKQLDSPVPGKRP